MSPRPIPAQVSKLLPLLGSDKDGEVVAAARALCRTLSLAEMDLHDLVKALAHRPQPRSKGTSSRRSWQAPHGQANPDADLVAWCLARSGDWLPVKDRVFLTDVEPRLSRWGGRLTLPQQEWLHDIRARVEAREAA